jgi:putative hydrolase of the HAD superfamily
MTGSLMRTKTRAVLFDLDDTLFDRSSAVEQTLKLMIEKFPDIFRGIALTEINHAFFCADDIARLEFNRGLSLQETRLLRNREFLSSLGLDRNYALTLDTFYVKSYPTVKAFVAGATTVITILAGTYLLGIISNGALEVQHQKLHNLGIGPFLNCIVFSEELGIKKPDSRIFLEASRLLKTRPEECLYVGDSYDTDVIGARNSGMRACWFNPGHVSHPPSKLLPDFEISTLDQLFDILDRD